MANENLGAAERIVQTVLTYSDHMVHNRPGVVVRDPSSVTGVRWHQALWKLEDGQKVVYRKDKTGVGKKAKTQLTRLGVMREDKTIPNVGRYKDPGIYPEVAVWLYRQVAEVWKLDNEFAARWASHVYMTDDNKDRKVVMAAFMLVQSRKGDPVLDEGKVVFHDEDFRDVGEAMVLLDGAKFLDTRLVLRILELLELPEIAAINRELGFGNSARNTFLGRFPKVAEKWLRYREENPKLLEGLVKHGFRTSVKRLAQAVKYKPTSARFFRALRWKQDQAKDGRRTLAIGEAVKAAESWVGLTEAQICEHIVKTKPNFKRIIGMLPEGGLTRAIMAASIESGALSDKDLTIYSPTLETLGLLQVPEIQARWQKALKAADDQRAANIAARMKSQVAKEALQGAAEAAAQKAVVEVLRNLIVYVIIDISGSMEDAIETAKKYIAKLLPAFPLDKLHVSVFNSSGRKIEIKHASAAGVTNALKGVTAGGATDYGAGVMALRNDPPPADSDALFLFIGDEQANDFSVSVQTSKLNPVAFALIPVISRMYGRGNAVRTTAASLRIPCFEIDEKIFNDPYAVPRTLRDLIASTPVGVRHGVVQAPRLTLVETILKTPLLQKPAWAA